MRMMEVSRGSSKNQAASGAIAAARTRKIPKFDNSTTANTWRIWRGETSLDWITLEPIPTSATTANSPLNIAAIAINP